MYNTLRKLREKRAEGASADNGFTLIELLVVVVIIGILVAIAIPIYLNYKKGAENKSAESDLRGAIPTIEQCFADNGSYPTALVQAAAGDNATLTGCDGATVTASDGNTLTYSITSGVYTMTATNSSGGTTYSYVSSNGKITHP
jgi:type IV pilus assembly protein PilA